MPGLLGMPLPAWLKAAWNMERKIWQGLDLNSLDVHVCTLFLSEMNRNKKLFFLSELDRNNELLFLLKHDSIKKI